MRILIAYDITSTETRTKFFKLLKNYGLNVQKSVFECTMTEFGLNKILSFIRANLDIEKDKFIIVPTCQHCEKQVFMLGSHLSLDIENFKVI